MLVRSRGAAICAAAGLVMVLLPAPAFADTTKLPAGEFRIEGANRFETSVAISRSSFTGPHPRGNCPGRGRGGN